VPEQTPVPDHLLTLEEAWTHLRISRSTLYNLMDSGELRSVRVGSRRLVPASAIAAYIASLPTADRVA
jgi:excisionase family DNA binding protein